MNKNYKFDCIIEGITKLNLLLMLFQLVLIYFHKLEPEKFITLFREQMIMIFFSCFLGKVIQKYQGYKFKTFKIKFSCILWGNAAYFALKIIYEYLLYYEGFILIRFILLFIASNCFWISALYMTNSNFLSPLMKFLHGTIEYKHFIQLFCMFNIAFSVIILLMISLGMMAGRSLFESIFIIFYFQASFIVFHVCLAKIFDFFWRHGVENEKKVSILGLYFASVIYVCKINLVDENVFGVIYANNAYSIIASVALIIFWTFFAVLFHFEIKFPKKKF